MTKPLPSAPRPPSPSPKAPPARIPPTPPVTARLPRPAPPPPRPAAVLPPLPPAPRPVAKEPETIRIRLADVSPLEDTVTSLEQTIAIPVDNDRARLDPPTVQLPSPAEARRGDDTPTVRVRVPRPPAAGRPELGDDVPQPAPQLPPPPRDYDDDDVAEVPPARRSRKPALVGVAIVLVLAVGAAVWFGAPNVFGPSFGGPSAVATAPPPSPAAPRTAHSRSANAPNPTAEGIAAALAGPPDRRHWGHAHRHRHRPGDRNHVVGPQLRHTADAGIVRQAPHHDGRAAVAGPAVSLHHHRGRRPRLRHRDHRRRRGDPSLSSCRPARRPSTPARRTWTTSSRR